MLKICAWCNKDLGSDGNPQSVITHGMCLECAAHFMSQIGRTLHEFLDTLGAPVLVVNSEGNINTANEKARTLFGKELGKIEGFRGGEAMECAYSRLPGGCGQTEHCKTCTIRMTVMDTHESGNSHKQIHAYQDISSPEGTKRMWFMISTEKVKDVVLLRIDDVAEAQEKRE